MEQRNRGTRGTRGQSTLEYILVVAAVLGVIIVAATALVGPGVNSVMNESGSTMSEAAKKVKTRLGL